MTKWEYLQLRYSEHSGWCRNYEPVTFDELGTEGWELVGFYSTDQLPYAVFKRQVPTKGKPFYAVNFEGTTL